MHCLCTDKQTTLRQGLNHQPLQPATKMNVVESPRHQRIRNMISYAPAPPLNSLNNPSRSAPLRPVPITSKATRMRPFQQREGAQGSPRNKMAQSLPLSPSNARVPPKVRESAMSSGAMPMHGLNEFNGMNGHNAMNAMNAFPKFNPQPAISAPSSPGGLVQSKSAFANDPDTTTSPRAPSPIPPLNRLDSAPILAPPPFQRAEEKSISFEPPPPAARRVKSNSDLPSTEDIKRGLSKSIKGPNLKFADLKALPDSPFDIRTTHQEFVKCANDIFGAYNNPRGLFKLLKDMTARLKLADPKYRLLDPGNDAVQRMIFNREDTKALQHELGPEYIREFLKLLGFATDIESGVMKCPRNQPPVSVIDSASHVCTAFISKCNSSRKTLLTIRKYSKNVGDLSKEINDSLRGKSVFQTGSNLQHPGHSGHIQQRNVHKVSSSRYHSKPLPQQQQQWLSSSMGAAGHVAMGTMNAYSSAESSSGASSGSSSSQSRRTSLGTIAASTTSEHGDGDDPLVINISINTAPSPIIQQPLPHKPPPALPLREPKEIEKVMESMDATDDDEGNGDNVPLEEDEKAVDDDVDGENDTFELRAIVWSVTSSVLLYTLDSLEILQYFCLRS